MARRDRWRRGRLAPAAAGGRRRPRPLAVAVAVGVGVGVIAAGCGWSDTVDSRYATAGLPTTLQDLEAHRWVLDPGDSSVDVDAATPATVRFEGEDDMVAGRAPCNSFRGRFELDGEETIEISHLASTRKACPEPVMRSEDEYLAALVAVDTVDVDDDGDRLVLRSDDDHRLSFTAHDNGD